MSEVMTAKQANKKAQSLRYKEGMNWENKIHKAFKKGGIIVEKKSVKSPDGLTKISDHTYGRTWMESTTHIDGKRKDEFINKKKFVLENSNEYDKFIIFYKHPIDPIKDTDLVSYKKELLENGIQLIDGESQAIAFINFLSTQIGKGVVSKIPVAKVEYVSIFDIYDNPVNREINEKAVADITDSIIENGFFGAFFVVPRIVDGEHRGWMLFEGHHRKHAYQRVLEWGLNIPTQVPIINVDWLSSEQQEELGELLIKVNVEYRSWQLLDYVRAQLELANQVGNDEKSFTYQRLLEIRDISKDLGLGFTMLWYAIGPKKPGSHWFDNGKVTSGKFRISESYSNIVDTFISSLRNPMKILHNKWTRTDERAIVKKFLREYLQLTFEQFKDDLDEMELKLKLNFISTWDTKSAPSSNTELESNEFKDRYNDYKSQQMEFLKQFQ